MLSKDNILELFELLNEELKIQGELGEIGIVGGAVMCLVYNVRDATRDVDAIFEPASIIRKIAAKLGEAKRVGSDWLNDAVKGFMQAGFLKQEVINLSNLRVWAPEARYMLAMKCISARWDTNDRDDVIFLIKHLKLKSAKQVFKIIESYYAKNKIPAKTQFFIEEVFEGARK